MATMERRKTLTMNWDGLGDDEDDLHFFETYNRLSTAVPDDLASSSDEDDDYEDSRLSFASAVSSFHPAKHRKPELPPATGIAPNYDIWMAAPGSITERRRRLLGSMGLDENKENLKATSIVISRAITKKFENKNQETPVWSNSVRDNSSSSSSVSANTTTSSGSPQQKSDHSPASYVLVRSRSEGDIDSFSWPFMIKGDPPEVPVHQSKKNSKRMLPPLPKKGNNHVTEGASSSPEHDPASLSRSESGIGDSFENSKRMLPPLPKKTNNQVTESEVEEDHGAISRTNSGFGDSFSSDSASIRYGDALSMSNAATPSGSSWSSNYSAYDGSSAVHPSAWGLVIVTAGFGGEIRCYQNFGLPRRMGRQAHLFGSPA